MSRKNSGFAVVMTALGFLLLPAQAAQVDRSALGPAELVEYTARQVLTVLESRRAELRENPEALYRAVDEWLLPVFDVQFAGNQVLGAQGQTATEEQRQRFANGLYQALVRQYAEYALDFSPDNLTVQPVRGTPEGQEIVTTQMRLPNNSTVTVRYVMRQTSQGWKLFDVHVEGVSYVLLFREQYGVEINRRGLDAVISDLERAARGEEVDLPLGPDLED